MNFIESQVFHTEAPECLEETEFLECTFQSLNLSDLSLKNSKFVECHFKNCNLSNTEVLNVTFREVTFKTCKMLGINWSLSKAISLLRIEDSQLDYSVFQELSLNNSEFLNSSMKEVDFSNSSLVKSIFSGSDLNMSNFTGVDLRESDFREAINYSLDPNFTKIRKAKFSLPEALSLLEHLEIEVS